MKIKIKCTNGGVTPSYAKQGDAGLDICSRETLTLLPNTVSLVKTGLYVELPEGYEFQVRSRSGLAKQGIMVANSPGTIDSGYRGEIGILLYNSKPFGQSIIVGDRIAQLVLQQVPVVEWEKVDELSDSERGGGGFGSTGR